MSTATDDIVLADDQRSAVRMATATDGARVMCLVGPPGTGKTTVVREIVRQYEARGWKYSLAAPTGKAARRLSEQTGRAACTIHRLLGPEVLPSGRWDFVHGAPPKPPLDTDVLVLDEVSMLDIELASHVLGSVPAHGRIVLVGDPDQLPSVGPGAVLRDMLASGVVPVAELTEIKRQNPGPLVRACHAIRGGKAPRVANEERDDLLVMGCDDEREIQDAVVDLVLRRLPAVIPDQYPDAVDDDGSFDRLRDNQVLTPMRERGGLSCKALNERFQAALWPDAKTRFRVGDKIIQTKNNYSLEILNGDIGFVVGEGQTSDKKRAILVDFSVAYPGRDVVKIPAADNNLELAYAITVHKAQGSEFPVTVIPVHKSFPTMLCTRNWIYTALSRARNLCVLVGQHTALARMVRNVSQAARCTGLENRLRRGFAEMAM